MNAFVARLSFDLRRLLAAAYLGGSREDYGYGVAATDDSVYVAGFTNSLDLPEATGGVQQSFQGGALDLFVGLFDASLHTLVQSTYLGGGGTDGGLGMGIALELADGGDVRSVYVAGPSESIDFPTTPNAAQPAFGGEADGVIARLTADLSQP